MNTLGIAVNSDLISAVECDENSTVVIGYDVKLPDKNADTIIKAIKSVLQKYLTHQELNILLSCNSLNLAQEIKQSLINNIPELSKFPIKTISHSTAACTQSAYMDEIAEENSVIVLNLNNNSEPYEGINTYLINPITDHVVQELNTPNVNDIHQSEEDWGSQSLGQRFLKSINSVPVKPTSGIIIGTGANQELAKNLNIATGLPIICPSEPEHFLAAGSSRYGMDVPVFEKETKRSWLLPIAITLAIVALIGIIAAFLSQKRSIPTPMEPIQTSTEGGSNNPPDSTVTVTVSSPVVVSNSPSPSAVPKSPDGDPYPPVNLPPVNPHPANKPPANMPKPAPKPAPAAPAAPPSNQFTLVPDTNAPGQPPIGYAPQYTNKAPTPTSVSTSNN